MFRAGAGCAMAKEVIPLKEGNNKGNNKLIAAVIFIAILVGESSAWATPPSRMDLTYDAKLGILHVEAHHPSDNLSTHYLRRLVVYQNGAQVKEMFYFKQNAPVKFTEDIPITAKEGDILAVEVFCIKGGSKRVEMTVTAPAPNTAVIPPKPAEIPTSVPKNTY